MFWVLNYICITRDGPGGKRRLELNLSNQNRDANLTNSPKMTFAELRHLQLMNYALFSAERRTLADTKKGLFKDDEYERRVVPCFHPYFKPLVPFMKDWWYILRFAHKYDLEDIHSWTLKAINRALAGLPKTIDTQAETDVASARQKELDDLQPKFDHDSKGKGRANIPPALTSDVKGKAKATWDISPQPLQSSNDTSNMPGPSRPITRSSTARAQSAPKRGRHR